MYCGIDRASKARQRKMTCDVSHMYQVISSHACLCMYIIHHNHKKRMIMTMIGKLVISDPRHTVLKSHRSKTDVIYIQSWKQCALPVITTMAFWQLMHLGTRWAMLQMYIMSPSAWFATLYTHVYICIYIQKLKSQKQDVLEWILNNLENSLENATGGVLEKVINKNPDPVKLRLYSLQL